jgi:hypothetical protein
VISTDHDVDGGCRIHMVGTQELQVVANSAGGPVVVFTCEDSYEAAVDANGDGYIYAPNIGAHWNGWCPRTACDEAGPSHATIPWPIEIRENLSGDEYLHLMLCLRNVVSDEGTAGTQCELEIPITQTTNPHTQSFNAEDGAGCVNLPPGAITLFVHWRTFSSAAHPEISIERFPIHSEIEVSH